MTTVPNRIFFCIAILASFGITASGATIFADDFNSPAPPFPVQTYGPGLFLTTGSTPPNTYGWFVSGVGIDHKAPGSDPTWPYVGSDGGSLVDLNSSGPGSMQVILLNSLVPGTPYTLSFNVAGLAFGAPIKTMTVQVDDGITTYINQTISITPVPNVTSSDWVAYSYTFTPNYNLIGITFSSLTEGEFGPLLDQVLLTGAAPPSPGPEIPEPATLVLVGSASLGFAFWRRQSA